MYVLYDIGGRNIGVGLLFKKNAAQKLFSEGGGQEISPVWGLKFGESELFSLQ